MIALQVLAIVALRALGGLDLVPPIGVTPTPTVMGSETPRGVEKKLRPGHLTLWRLTLVEGARGEE